VGCSIPIRKRWNAPIVNDLITTPNQTTTSTKDNFHDDDDGIESHKRHSQVLYRMQQTNNLALDGRHSSTSHLPKTPTIGSQKPILVENSQRIRDQQNSLQQLPQGHPDKTDLTSPPPPPRDFPAASLRPTPTTPAPKPSSLSLSQNTRFRVLHTHTHTLSLSLSKHKISRLHAHTSLSLSLRCRSSNPNPNFPSNRYLLLKPTVCAPLEQATVNYQLMFLGYFWGQIWEIFSILGSFFGLKLLIKIGAIHLDQINAINCRIIN